MSSAGANVVRILMTLLPTRRSRPKATSIPRRPQAGRSARRRRPLAPPWAGVLNTCPGQALPAHTHHIKKCPAG